MELIQQNVICPLCDFLIEQKHARRIDEFIYDHPCGSVFELDQYRNVLWFAKTLHEISDFQSTELYWLNQWSYKNVILTGWYYWETCDEPINLEIDISFNKENFLKASKKAAIISFYE
jgi:hypothetical protein